jgi:hypothetical protein
MIAASRPIGREVDLCGAAGQIWVFGLTGNHEYYFQAPQMASVFENLGTDMLHNEQVGGVGSRDSGSVIAVFPTTRTVLEAKARMRPLPVAGAPECRASCWINVRRGRQHVPMCSSPATPRRAHDLQPAAVRVL